MINILIVLNNLLNSKSKGNAEMSDRVAQLESQFTRLAAIGSSIEVQINVVTLLPSLSEQKKCAPTIATVLTIQNEIGTWSYVTSILIEQISSLKNR